MSSIVLKSSQVALVHNPLVFQYFSNGNILCSGYPQKNPRLSGVRVVHDWAYDLDDLQWRLKEKGQGASVILVVSCRWKQPIYCLVIGFPVEDVGFTISMSEDVWRFWDHSRFCCKHLPWKSFQQLILDDFGTLIQLESSVVRSIFNFGSSALILLLAQPRLDTSELSSFALVKATNTLKSRRFAGYLQTLCHQERHVAGKGPERGSEAWRGWLTHTTWGRIIQTIKKWWWLGDNHRNVQTWWWLGWFIGFTTFTSIAVGYSNGDVRWIRQNGTQHLVLHDKYYNMILYSI